MKKVCHEREKTYMEALQGAGNVIVEYAGDGQGESEDTTGRVDFDAVDEQIEVSQDADCTVDFDAVDEQIEVSPRDADWGDDEWGDVSAASIEVSNDGSTHPLLLLYDCESTGLSIYNEHIIEIAAEVVGPPALYINTTFTSLVKTARSIPSSGTTGLKIG